MKTFEYIRARRTAGDQADDLEQRDSPTMLTWDERLSRQGGQTAPRHVRDSPTCSTSGAS
jgi:hypothetical protein